MRPDVIGGRYRVVRAIGTGGMGTVWLCRDERLDRDVAVKQVGLFPGESATDSARALREARASAALNHRNLVTIFDIVEEADAVWMVMEYVPGRALADIVRDDGPLPPAEVAAIGAQIAEGLATVHAVGTMHRDVKPGNILVRDDGQALLGDFGIARRAGDPALTQTGFVTGTPLYFSPELARGAAPGPESDVWALGASLYAAVEGRPPYPPQANPVAVLHDIATRQPERPARAGFLEPALMRMLDRDPASRWSMADAAHSLKRLAEEHRAGRTRENTLGLAAGAVGAAGAAAADEDADDRPTAVGAAGPAGAPERSAAPPPAGPAERSGRRRRLLPGLVALAVVLLALGTVAAIAALRDDGGTADGASGSPSTTSSRTSRPSASPSSSSSKSSAAPSPSRSSSPSPSSSPSSSRSASAGDQAAFLRDYFATAPQDTDAGWARLGPNEQSVGRSSYDRFWGSIDSVDVGDVRPSGNAVEVDLTYHYADGRVVAERQRLDLVSDGSGGYLIDNDDVLSSRTVSG